MPITKLTPDFPFTEDRLAELKQVIPEAFADGKINWDVLRETLGEHLEEESEEHFGLSWPGKSEARRLAAQPSKGTLAPCPGEGVNEDDTENIFIEGENLEVMKILLKSYAGKIKMIFIDPPYNTGNEFLYNDKFQESLDVYLSQEGVLSEDGELLTSNLRSDGRYHSRWLNMIFPRLIIAKQFLRDDGIFFVTIDENEEHHLRLVLDEIFGENNYIGTFIWNSRTSISNDKLISKNHNYVFVYAKNLASAIFEGYQLDDEQYSNPDDDPRGPWKLVPIDANKPGGDTQYGIINPDTGEEYFPPNGRSWAFNPSEYQRLLNDGRIAFGKTGEAAPKKKLFLSERQQRGDTKTPGSILQDVGTTKNGTEEMMELFDGKKVFSYPKPTSLLEKLIQFGTIDNGIILDFFAGSGTTGHAVFSKNHEDKSNLSFILIQMPEEIDRSREEGNNCQDLGIDTISKLAIERLKRAANRLNENRIQNLQRNLVPPDSLEYSHGFKVFQLTNPTFPVWNEFSGQDLTLFKNNISEYVNLFDGDKDLDDVLYETLLIEGFPLTSEISFLENMKSNQIYHISAPAFSDHDLFICLDQTIADNTLDLLPLKDQDIFICLDSALSDELKVRLEDQFNIHVI